MIKIAIDIDGVLVNSHYILIDVYNKKYGKNITLEDANKWNYFPKKVFKKIYSETCKRIGEYELLDTFAPYYMFLFNNKHDVDILTHQGNSRRKLKECLQRLGIRRGFEYDKIIKTKEKKAVYDYDVFIDDNPKMIIDLVDYSKKYLLLYDLPANRSYDCSLYRNVFRVHDFKEVSDKIEQLEKIIKI